MLQSCNIARLSCQFAGADKRDDVYKCGRPGLNDTLAIGAERFDIQADCIALLRLFQVEESRAEDAFRSGGGMLECGGETQKSINPLLLLSRRGKGAFLTPNKVNITGDGCA